MKRLKQFTHSFKKKFKSKFLILLSISLAIGCIQKNDKQHNYWSDFYSLQATTKRITNYFQYSALMGSLSKEHEEELKKNSDGDFYLEIAGNKSQGEWNLNLYPESSSKSDYFSKVTFHPTKWENKDIYLVQRETHSKWNGYMPRDFFLWLNQFTQVVNRHEDLIKLKQNIPSFQFLCKTFECQSIEEAKNIVLEFTFSDKTEDAFPNFYEKMGSRLTKTQFEMKIFDENFPEDLITISNQGKSIQIRFPVNPRKEIFKKPKSIHFVTNIVIKSYGVTLQIQEIKYNVLFTSVPMQDVLEGKFIGFKSRKFSGRFLYFIPTGVIDFFIPGNIDEYLNDALTLLIYGTQGKGGSQFKAVYTKSNQRQENLIRSYSEIMRNRFSLFGADKNQMENPEQDFFGQWENKILSDLH